MKREGILQREREKGEKKRKLLTRTGGGVSFLTMKKTLVHWPGEITRGRGACDGHARIWEEKSLVTQKKRKKVKPKEKGKKEGRKREDQFQGRNSPSPQRQKEGQGKRRRNA